MDNELNVIQMNIHDKLKFEFTGTYDRIVDDGVYRDITYISNNKTYVIKDCRLLHESRLKQTRYGPLITMNILLTRTNKIVVLETHKQYGIKNLKPLVLSVPDFINDKRFFMSNYPPKSVVNLLLRENRYIPNNHIVEIK